MAEKKFMSMALEEAYRGIEAGDGGPFGAVVVRSGEVLGAAHNTVLRDNDPTRHAEISAVSIASRKLGTFDLSGCTVYSTTEPCPMCFSSLHWARISVLIYGTKIEAVRELGFNEMAISVEKMNEESGSAMEIIGGFMSGECEKLLGYWGSLPDQRVY
ncbi:MAG: nucleoside deaminase [Candidatus Omnitrophota bacterium]|nr:nucleoside deaminase [Candidatus Omnitrophota bacterium]